MFLYNQLEFFKQNVSMADDYIQHRGLDQKTIQEFEIGFCPFICPEEVNSFSNRLIFPINNLSGEVIAFGGRSLNGEKPKFINSPESNDYKKSRVLYNLDKAQDYILNSGVAIVVEGYFDVIQLWNSGIRNVVASCGTAITKHHIRLLKRFADEVVICYDGDAAGEKAAERALEGLADEQIPISNISLPGGLDPDDFIKTNGIDKFKEILNGKKESNKL